MSWFLRCPTCADRCELPKLIPDGSVCVEVGVMHANYSKELLGRWPDKVRMLHLIDPWQDSLDYSFTGMFSGFSYQDHQHNYRQAMENIAPFRGRCRIWRERNSWELSERIGLVDLAYVDGNHEFQHVAHDMDVWWDHLKPGGVLAGHDLFQVDYPGVTEAVVLFAHKHGKPVCIVPGKDGCPCAEGGVPSWYFRKD